MPNVPTLEGGLIDAWFLDGFAPSKNPEMWNQELFNNMAKLSKPDGTCATFTAAGFVRRGLIEAGFDMKKVKGFGTKREMIAGTRSNKTSFSNIQPYFARQATSSQAEDIAIIGGGIASATLAKTLARRGVKVTLYCADEKAAQGASGNRQGAVYPLLNGDHSGVSKVFAPGMLFARQFVEQCADEISFDHDWCGVTQLMWNEDAEKKLTRMLKGNFPAELISHHNEQETDGIVGLPCSSASVSYPLGGWLCPAQLTQGIIDKLVEQGKLEVVYSTPIDNIRFDENTQLWQLETSQQTFNHQAVVVANGHQFDQFNQTQHLPLGKVKGQVSHVPTTEALTKLKTVLCYDGYMTPQNANTQTHCIGASYDRSNIDQVFDPLAQQDNGEKLKKCLPEQPWVHDVDTSDNQSRQGVRCVSRDHLPFVGNVGDFEAIKAQYADLKNQPESEIETITQYPNLFCFLGLGSRGLSSAPLMAELLASQICGDPLPLPVDVLDSLHPSKMWVRKLRKGKALTEL